MHEKHKFTMAPNVTNWGGTLLDPKCIEKLKRGDIVRIFVGNCAPYYIIMKFRGKCCIGIRYDVYTDNLYNFKCNYCARDLRYGETVYCCNGDVGETYTGNECGTYICEKCPKECHKKNDCKILACKLERKNIPRIMKFPKWSISEIPNWSKNTENFEELYGMDECRVVTGMYFNNSHLVKHWV
jgi:hypothetical protein